MGLPKAHHACFTWSPLLQQNNIFCWLGKVVDIFTWTSAKCLMLFPTTFSKVNRQGTGWISGLARWIGWLFQAHNPQNILSYLTESIKVWGFSHSISWKQKKTKKTTRKIKIHPHLLIHSLYWDVRYRKDELRLWRHLLMVGWADDYSLFQFLSIKWKYWLFSVS